MISCQQENKINSSILEWMTPGGYWPLLAVTHHPAAQNPPFSNFTTSPNHSLFDQFKKDGTTNRRIRSPHLHSIATHKPTTGRRRTHQARNGKGGSNHSLKNLDAGPLPPHRNPPDLRDGAAVNLRRGSLLRREHHHDDHLAQPLHSVLLLLPLHRQLSNPRRQGGLRLRHHQRAGGFQVRVRTQRTQRRQVPCPLLGLCSCHDVCDGVPVDRVLGSSSHHVLASSIHKGNGGSYGEFPFDGRDCL